MTGEVALESGTVAFDLKQLLAPLTVADFTSQYFEKQPLILSRNNKHYYSTLLSVHEVESLVFTLSAPKNKRWFQLIKDGQTLPIRPPLVDDKGDLVPSRVITSYHQGFTVVLNQLQRRSPSVSALCRSLEDSLVSATDILLKSGVTANAYLTPRKAQGFSPHYDDHDVFIVQLGGAKNWRIYRALEHFPLEPLSKIQRSRLDHLHEIELKPGDLLYVPRGFPHEALTGDAFSLHLTLGIRSYTWVDFVSSIAVSDPRLRSSLHFNPSRPEPAVLAGRSQIESLINVLCDERRFIRVLRKLMNRKLTAVLPPPSDHFEAIHHLDFVTTSTLLRKRHDSLCWLEKYGDYLTLHFPGNTVTYPQYAESALQFMIASERFAPGSIPDLPTEKERLALVKRLVAEGFLNIVR